MNGSNLLYNTTAVGLSGNNEFDYIQPMNKNIDYLNYKREDSFFQEQGKSKFIKTTNKERVTTRVENKILNNKIPQNLLYLKEDTKCHISKIRNDQDHQCMSSLTTISPISKQKKSSSEYNRNHNDCHNNNNNNNTNKNNKKLYHNQLRSNNIHNYQCRKNNSSKICKRCYIQKMQQQIEFIKERKQRTTVYVREFNDFLKYENLYEKIIHKEEQKKQLQNLKTHRILTLDTSSSNIPIEKYVMDNKIVRDNTNEYNTVHTNRDSTGKLSEQISFKKNLFLFLNNVFKKH